MIDWSRVDEMLRAATVDPEHGTPSADMVSPGMACLVGQGGELLYKKSFGCRSLEPEVSPLENEMVFDVASLTKALVSTTLCMKLVEKGRQDIDKPVANYLQSFGTLGKSAIKVRNLLNHSSGFEAHRKFYLDLEKAHKRDRQGILKSRGAQEFVRNELFRSSLEYETGSKSVYSDLGFLLLGNLLELLWHSDGIEEVARREIFQPLGLRATGYINLQKGQLPNEDVLVPCNHCPWRENLICGEVQDENCWALGGVAAHAGMFSNLEDVFRMSQALLDSSYGRGNFVDTRVVNSFWKRDESVADSTWALGWDTPTEGKSSSGKYFSPGSVGHLAYTGCSLWIDVPREIIVVLLTNRLHPKDGNKSIREFRPLFHDLVMHSMGFGEMAFGSEGGGA